MHDKQRAPWVTPTIRPQSIILAIRSNARRKCNGLPKRRVHAWTGNYPDALRCLTEAREITGSREPGILAGLGYTFARSGKRDEAVKILDRLEEMSRTRYVPSFYLASVHVGLGNTDMAFEWLEKAYRNRSEWMVFLKVEHILTPLRNDPRFSSLVKRVGLPDLE